MRRLAPMLLFPAESRLDPWIAAETDPLHHEEPREAFHFAVRHAVLAPSGHNTQPWLFTIRDDALDVYADRARALSVVDPDDRALVMSCGAALLQVRIALRHLGCRPHVELHPANGDADLLAMVRLDEQQPPGPAEEELFGAIACRRTNRSAFEDRPLPDALLDNRQGAGARVIRKLKEREAVASLVTEGDRIQGADPAFRRELAAWIHPNRSRSRDGMPGYAFGAGDLKSYLGPLVIRTFDWGCGQGARDRQLALGSPALVVLHTDGDSPGTWLEAGQALARVLLRATAEGVAASFLNQAIEVEGLRPRLRDTLELDGIPQLLLRLGYGPEVRPTPRRSADEVVREP